MDVQRVADGLWRWTVAPPGGEAVGSVYLELPAAVVLVDAVLPPTGDPERERFWRALDRDVERLRRPVLAVETRAGAGPDADAVAARYPGARRWRPGDGCQLASDLVATPLGGAAGTGVALWIPAHRTLLPGRALCVDDHGRLALADDVELSATAVRALLELPVERVLPTLGPAILSDGGVALSLALSRV